MERYGFDSINSYFFLAGPIYMGPVEHQIIPQRFPVAESRANQMGGIKRAGSRFMVEISLSFKRFMPLARMSKPPMMAISVIIPSPISGASVPASK